MSFMNLGDESFTQLVVDEARGRLEDEEAHAFVAEAGEDLTLCTRWRHALGVAMQQSQQALIRIKEDEARDLAEARTHAEAMAVRSSAQAARSAVNNHITKLSARMAAAKTTQAELRRQRDDDDWCAMRDIILRYFDSHGPLDFTDHEQAVIDRLRSFDT